MTDPSLVRAAAGALSGKAAATGERADQRHLAGLVFFQPEDAGQRLAGCFRKLDAEQLGKLGRKAR